MGLKSRESLCPVFHLEFSGLCREGQQDDGMEDLSRKRLETAPKSLMTSMGPAMGPRDFAGEEVNSEKGREQACSRIAPVQVKDQAIEDLG